MLFDYKEDLQLDIKKYCVTEHYEIVVESKQNIWYVGCKQWKEIATGGYMEVGARVTKCLKLLGSKGNTHVCI